MLLALGKDEFQQEDQKEPGNVSKTVTLFLFDFEFLTYEYISWPDMYTQRTFDEDRHENPMFSLSLVYCFFCCYYLRSDFQQTTNKARYDAICVQECPNFNIWGYGLRSKRFEGSRLYSKIILVLQATKRWGSGLHGKNLGLQGYAPPPPLPPFGPCYIVTSVLLENIPPVKFIKTTFGTRMVYFP